MLQVPRCCILSNCAADTQRGGGCLQAEMNCLISTLSQVLSLLRSQTLFPSTSTRTRACSPVLVPVLRTQLQEQPPGWLDEGEKNLPGTSTLALNVQEGKVLQKHSYGKFPYLIACNPHSISSPCPIHSHRVSPHTHRGPSPHPAPSLTGSPRATAAPLPAKQLHQG